jgi:succinate-semialdehyde dehydrogenase/glutarate-semialdehyde dehydrogenase
MQKIISINPADNSVVGEVPVSSQQEIIEKVQQAHAVKQQWKMLGATKRAEMLRPLLEIFKQRAEEIARVSSQEIGKPLTQSLADIETDIIYFNEFIENGPKYIENEITVQEPSAFHQIVYEPIGVAACIVPWNYPFGNFIMAVIPLLIAGNPVILKHSEECPLIGKMAEEMMQELNLPLGVFSEVYGDAAVGRALVEQDINLISFTGSSQAGQELFKHAGNKKIHTILEMGGSDPAVIFEDSPIDEIIPKIYERRFDNCGQICCAVKRLIVQESIYDEVVAKLVKHLSTIKVGDPLEMTTQMGPLAAMRQLELLESQITDAVSYGAKVAVGGKRPEGFTGAYYLPTILTGINRQMRVWKEELFGPVLPVIAFKDEAEAIELANDTIYGLGGTVFSADLPRARRVAAQLEAGYVDINFGNHWRPHNPFGGYKASGMGRIYGKTGFQQLCQVKVIAE